MVWEPGFHIFIANLLLIICRYAYYNALCSSLCKHWALWLINCCWLLARRANPGHGQAEYAQKSKTNNSYNWEGYKRIISFFWTAEQQTTDPTCIVSHLIQYTDSWSDHTCLLTIFLPLSGSILCTSVVRDKAERDSCVMRAQAQRFGWTT